MLTARGRPEDILKGFESGADDYLPKPFNLDILVARIGGLLRRKNWLQSATEPSPPPADEFSFAGKTVDFQKLQLHNGKQIFQLTLMETELLRYLIRNGGRPVARKEILEQVWDLKEDTDTRAIDNFIVRLRRYIENDPTKPKHLLTVQRTGLPVCGTAGIISLRARTPKLFHLSHSTGLLLVPAQGFLAQRISGVSMTALRHSRRPRLHSRDGIRTTPPPTRQLGFQSTYTIQSRFNPGDPALSLRPSADVPSARPHPGVDALLKTKGKVQFERTVDSLSRLFFGLLSNPFLAVC